VPDQKIKSTVTSGTVTLEGVVDNWMERYNAEKAINRLTGVKGVINKLTTAAKAIDAAQVKRDIESALERQTEREAKRLGVAVHDGTVTLTGSVRSWGEKNSAERVAWATAGVRHVNDQTTVDPYL
jgi:osmotically-inducible protein OsmY